MQSLQYAQASSCNILQPTWLSPAPPRSPVLQLNTNPHSNDIMQGCYIYPNSQPIQGNSMNSPPIPGITCFVSQVPPQFYTYGMGMRPVQSTQPVQYCSCYNCSQLMHPLTYPNRPAVPLVHSATNFAQIHMSTNSINMPSSLVQQQLSPQPQTLNTTTSPLQPKQLSFQPQTLYYPQSCTPDTRTNPSLNLQPQPQTIITRTGPPPQTKTTIAKTLFTLQSQPQTIMTANIFVPPRNVEATVRIEPNSLLSIPSLQESLERGLSDVCSNVNHLEDCENPATPLTPGNLCIVETPEEDIQIVGDDDELTSPQTTDINNRLPFMDFCTSENNASGPPYDKSTTIVKSTADFIRPPLLAPSKISSVSVGYSSLSSVSVGYSSPSVTTVVSSSMMESIIMTSTLPRMSPAADSEEVSSVTATSVAATTDPKNICSCILSKEPPSTTTVLCSSDVCDKMDTLNSLVSSETVPSDEFVLNSLILPIDSFLKSLENSNDLDINSAEMSSNDTPSLNTDEYSIDSILPVFNECLRSLDTSLVQPLTVSTSSVDEIPLITPVSGSCSNYSSPLMISIPLDRVTIPKSRPNSQPESQTHVSPHSTSLVISIPKLVWQQASNVTKRNDSITKIKKMKISSDTSVTTAPNDDTKIKMASDTTDGSKNKYPAKSENHLRAKVKKKLRKILAQSPLLSSQDRKVIRSFFSHTGKCPLPPKPHRKYALRYCEKFQRYIGIEMNYINKKWRGVCVTDITGLDNTKRLVSKHKSSSKADKVM